MCSLSALDIADTNCRNIGFCAISDSEYCKDDMIRFVVSPDGFLVPDVLEKLPGKEVWVKADRDVILKMIKDKYILEKYISFEGELTVPDKTLDIIITSLKENIINLISIARKMGKSFKGFDKVKDSFKNKSDYLIFFAIGCSDRNASRLNVKKENCVLECLSQEELGKPFGISSVTYLSVIGDANFLDKLFKKCSLLRKVRTSSL